jgi:hypothetical protein
MGRNMDTFHRRPALFRSSSCTAKILVLPVFSRIVLAFFMRTDGTASAGVTRELTDKDVRIVSRVSGRSIQIAHQWAPKIIR